MPDYKLSIIVEGEDKATGPLGSAGSALGNMAQIAGGIIGAQVFQNIANGIMEMGKSAVAATADYQAMQIGLESLLAREISRGTTVKQTVNQNIQLSAAERLELMDLEKQYGSLADKKANLTKEYERAVQQSGANSEAALRYRAELDKTGASVNGMAVRMAFLKDASDGVISTMANVQVGTMKLAEAMPLAQERAKKLMEELSRIAITSPFRVGTIQDTFKTAMAYGFAADEAKTFTQALLNVAAGIGASDDKLQRMGYSLSQIRMQGKITGMEMRELAMAGFDLTDVLRFTGDQFGLTINDYEDFNAALASGKITFQDFVKSFDKYSKENFGNAAERMGRTLKGFSSTLSDVFALTVPTLLMPAAEVFTEFAGGVLDDFLKIRDSGVLDEWGKNLGASMKTAIGWMKSAREGFTALANVFKTQGFSGGLKTVFGNLFPPNASSIFNKAVDDIGAGVKSIIKFFQNPMLGSIVKGFFTTLGKTIGDLGGIVIPWVTGKFKEFGQWFTDNEGVINQFVFNIGAGINQIIGAGKSLIENLIPAFNWLTATIGSAATTVLTLANGDWAGAWEGIKTTAGNALNTVKSIVLGISQWVYEGVTGGKWEDVKATWAGIWNMMGTIVDKVVGDIKGWVNSIQGAVQGAIDAIKRLLEAKGWVSSGSGKGSSSTGGPDPDPTPWTSPVPQVPEPPRRGGSQELTFSPRKIGTAAPNNAVAGKQAINSYNLYLTTTASAQVVVKSFETMRVLNNARA
jgi:tape measure domain-containing protein